MRALSQLSLIGELVQNLAQSALQGVPDRCELLLCTAFLMEVSREYP